MYHIPLEDIANAEANLIQIFVRKQKSNIFNIFKLVVRCTKKTDSLDILG